MRNSITQKMKYKQSVIKFSFKYASSISLINSLLDIHGSRINGGKLITIYPQNKEHCSRLLYDLYRFLKNFSGPIVLTDAQFKRKFKLLR